MDNVWFCVGVLQCLMAKLAEGRGFYEKFVGMHENVVLKPRPNGDDKSMRAHESLRPNGIRLSSTLINYHRLSSPFGRSFMQSSERDTNECVNPSQTALFSLARQENGKKRVFLDWV